MLQGCGQGLTTTMQGWDISPGSLLGLVWHHLGRGMGEPCYSFKKVEIEASTWSLLVGVEWDTFFTGDDWSGYWLKVFCLARLVFLALWLERAGIFSPFFLCMCWHFWVVGSFTPWLGYTKQKGNPGNSVSFLGYRGLPPSLYLPVYLCVLHMMFKAFSWT